MDTERRSNLPLMAGLFLSVLVHAGIILPLLIMIMTLKAVDPLRPRAAFAADPITEEEEQEEEDDAMRLGIESEPSSSLTWIGYDEYQEHLAQLAEFDQAAFEIEPTGGGEGGVAPSPAQQPIESPESPEEPDEAIEPNEITPEEPADALAAAAAAPEQIVEDETPEVAQETIPAPPVDTLVEADTLSIPAMENAEDPTVVATEGETLAAPRVDRLEEMRGRMDKFIQGLVEASEALAQTSPVEPEEPADAMAEKGEDEQDGEPAEETPAEVAAASASDAPRGSNRSGEQSDRESDPTSVIEVTPENWKNGKPLAAYGLTIETKRPTLTEVTRITSAPCNPTYRIVFRRFTRRNGEIYAKPIDHTLIAGTCDSRVDRAVTASLYRWRATGTPLKKLKDGDRFEIRIRLVFR